MKKTILILLALAWLVTPVGAAQYLNGVGLQSIQAFFDWLATNTYVQTESDPVFVESPAKNLASNDLVLARAAVQPDTVNTALLFSAYRIIQLTNGLGMVTLVPGSCASIADPASAAGWDAGNSRRPVVTNAADSFTLPMTAGTWEGSVVSMSFDFSLVCGDTNWSIGTMWLYDGGATKYVDVTTNGTAAKVTRFDATYGCTSAMPANLSFGFSIFDNGGGISYVGVSNITVKLYPCPATTNKISVE